MTTIDREPFHSVRTPQVTARSKFEMSTQWPSFDVGLVTVRGDVDAARDAELLDYALSKALLCRLLILNLERVRFLSCSSFDMLRTLERRCAMADVELSVLYGASATRMLQICEAAHQRAC